MPIYPFERSVYPRRFASPFISGKNVKGPGGIGDVIEKGEGEKIEGGGTGRKRPRKTAPSGANSTPGKPEHTDRVGPSKGLYVGPANVSQPTTTSSYPYQPPAPTQHMQTQTQLRGMGDRSLLAAAGGVAALGLNISIEKLPPETGEDEVSSRSGANFLIIFSLSEHSKAF